MMLLQTETLSELVASGSDAERSGEWTEALNQYEAALRQATAAEDFPRVPDLLRAIGRLHFERGDYDRASDVFRASLTQAESYGNSSQTAAALNCLGVVEQFRGRINAADEFYTLAAQLADKAQDQRLSAMILQNLATLATIKGDFEVALERSQDALAVFRALKDDLAAARVLNNLGMLYLDTQQLGHAELSYRSALSLADRLGDAGLRVKIQTNRAELALARNDFESAHEFCDDAFRAYTKLGSESGLSDVYKVYGILYRETGNAPLASTHLELSIKLAQACGDRLLEAEAERERALLLLNEGRNREALTALNCAHRLFQELQARREVADIQRKLERVERIYLRVVEMLESELAISFDPAAVEQYRRVAQYSVRLAAEVGFSGRDLTWLRIGAFLYDIGKRSVPDPVLNKRGRLDPDEWDAVKRHVFASEQVVADLDPPWDMRPMVRHHHEHWDGTGYPDGLAGEDIPLTARILCIADAFTALTSPRSFRKKMTEREAVDLMQREVGRTFDPALFAKFRALIEK